MNKKVKAKPAYQETKRVGKFGLVGIINTLIDVSLFNLLIILANFSQVPANLVSTTVAMTFSFFANKTFVFKNKSDDYGRQAILFFLVTAFGLYVIQNVVIYTLTQVWQWPLEVGYAIVSIINLDEILGKTFIFNNGAKAFAILSSLSWNYIMYKKVVFRK